MGFWCADRLPVFLLVCYLSLFRLVELAPPFKVKIVYLVGMFVFLHVLVLYVERSCEVWPRRNQ